MSKREGKDRPDSIKHFLGLMEQASKEPLSAEQKELYDELERYNLQGCNIKLIDLERGHVTFGFALPVEAKRREGISLKEAGEMIHACLVTLDVWEQGTANPEDRKKDNTGLLSLELHPNLQYYHEGWTFQAHSDMINYRLDVEQKDRIGRLMVALETIVIEKLVKENLLDKKLGEHFTSMGTSRTKRKSKVPLF